MSRALCALVLTSASLAGCASAPPATPEPGAEDLGKPSPHDHDEHAHDHGGHGEPQPAPDDGATPEPAHPEPADARAAELAAYDRAKPVFERHCVRCHRPGEPGAKPGSLEHLSMAGYPFGGHHAHEITGTIRASLGVGGKATMPKDHPGAVKGDELALVLAWADAADRAAKTLAQPAPEPHHH